MSTEQKQRPFEEVQAEIHQTATKVELEILTVLQFDFEFDFPMPFIRGYFNSERAEKSMVDLDQLETI